MIRNVVVLSGNSHPKFVDSVCNYLGIPPASRVLEKFSSGETRCEIRDSIRGKDVYIIQSFGVGTNRNAANSNNNNNNNDGSSTSATAETGHVTVNDYFIELCIMISACKTGSARRVTAVLPFFPYSRQPDLPYASTGAPLVSRNHDAVTMTVTEGQGSVSYTFESVPPTPAAHIPRTAGLANGMSRLANGLSGSSITRGSDIRDMAKVMVTGPASDAGSKSLGEKQPQQQKANDKFTTHDFENPAMAMAFQQKVGFKPMMAQAGSLIADLLTCAGADRIVTCDLHESTYQGFFDIPVDHLIARPLLKRYIQHHIENYKEAVIVSPDAGGAKRAAAIADSLGLQFALIHKERRRPSKTHPNYPSMMLVGNVANRICILVDDLADTVNTITRAAKLLKREGAVQVVALITHGVFSGDAIQRINASALDRVVVTNTVAQHRHLEAFGAARAGGTKEMPDKNKNDVDPRVVCGKLEVLDIAPFFAEAIRRIVFGESISMLVRDGD
ncbi:ribose-phosphate pyrophosphokinase II [Neurospora crassa OR74A]|uniref:Ribose-phosphate pyrophosphokinase II n=2 Tax=Neurospora crassa TaxID=5141 RepID=V5IP51_NEUCR|nr:ribose-phosphate pyrophosphokinase II [Neurospora crassa OR74A]ESA42531.1 ribose-phosphate pyrophosphokinase II [Neurospora crassa OR74A]CAE76123.1 related to ribose-phosphate pyrophosphokinase II [Neurospora crassa]|eukprot:XP_011394494.1 ribose-phosphate pyrophosphokinase II [Neurospora crassa OR74A]